MTPPPEPRPMPPVDAVTAPRGILTVRPNRTHCLMAVLTGFPLAVLFTWLNPVAESDFVSEFLFGMVVGLGVLNGISGLWPLMRRQCFRVELGARKIIVPGHWSNNRRYPRAGYTRIEFSPYDGCIYEVGSDGRRSRVPVSRRFANRRDWETVVDLLLTQRPATPARETEDER